MELACWGRVGCISFHWHAHVVVTCCYVAGLGWVRVALAFTATLLLRQVFVTSSWGWGGVGRVGVHLSRSSCNCHVAVLVWLGVALAFAAFTSGTCYVLGLAGWGVLAVTVQRRALHVFFMSCGFAVGLRKTLLVIVMVFYVLFRHGSGTQQCYRAWYDRLPALMFNWSSAWKNEGYPVDIWWIFAKYPTNTLRISRVWERYPIDIPIESYPT